MDTIKWNEIYIKTSPKLLGICRRYIKDIATAEDIIQDSFIVAIQKESTLKNADALNGWLSRIVVNMAIHHLKEVKKINFSTQQDYEIVDSTTVMNTYEIDTKSMLLASDLEKSDILEAIDQLPEHHKSVFNMYVIDQFTHNEISKILTISVGTSKSHLFRARKAVQAFLVEKIKGKAVDKKKKRRIAFLLFLGFENRMFANFYKRPFQDFEIQPQKTFEMASTKMPLPDQFIGLTKVALGSKIIVAGFSCVFLTAIVWYVYTFTPTASPQEKRNILKIEPASGTVINPIVVTTKDSLKNKKPAIVPAQTETISAAKKVTVLKGKSEKTLEQPTAATPDPAQNEPQKVVVIKKQIVKKDTVYVTK